MRTGCSPVGRPLLPGCEPGDERGERGEGVLTRRRFIDTLAIVRFLRDSGVECVLGRCSLRDVIGDVRRGHPVIVVVRPDLGPIGRWLSRRMPMHCWVVRGVDAAGSAVFVNTPASGPVRVGAARFASVSANEGCVAIRSSEAVERAAAEIGGR